MLISMTKKTIYLGKNKADFQTQEVKGEMINLSLIHI